MAKKWKERLPSVKGRPRDGIGAAIAKRLAADGGIRGHHVAKKGRQRGP